jgi:hypothetical protein
MGRRKVASIRITVSYSSNQVAVYAYDEHTGRSVAEVIQNDDSRYKDLEAVKTRLCESLKGEARVHTRHHAVTL